MRLVFALLVTASLFSGALSADRITYWKSSGGKRAAETAEKVVVQGWNAREVTYRTADGKSVKVDTASVIAVMRTVGEGGSMGKELQDAMELGGKDATAAREALAAVASKGAGLDKEEALFRRAESFGGGSTAEAIREYQAYTSAYKGGFFARDAWTTLADLQVDAGKAADARATLRAMIAADTALAQMGNQKLGELEVRARDLKAALAAFKAAEATAGDDRNAKYLAMACQGDVMQRSGDNNGAKDLLEKVTGDESFEDETSNSDERALGAAWPALAQVYYETGNFEKAYSAFVVGAYYVWWNQGSSEGFCLRQACICAKKLQSSDEKWKSRYDKLYATLTMGYPKEVQEVDKAK